MTVYLLLNNFFYKVFVRFEILCKFVGRKPITKLNINMNAYEIVD